MIFVHNHPSGDPTASLEDRQLTDRLVRGGDLLGIPILDHIVVGAETYTRFADAGWIGGLAPGQRVSSAVDRY
jgi:DNA repair protein RadC